MYEEPIFGKHKSSHLDVGDLDMNTVSILVDPCTLSSFNRKVRKDAICVNAPDGFARGNLDGRFFFWSSDLLTHHGQSPRVKVYEW